MAYVLLKHDFEMQSDEFLKLLGQQLSSFLNAELQKMGLASRFEIESGLASLNGEADKRGLWSRLSGQGVTRAYLQSYSIQRTQASRSSVLKVEEVEENGQKVYLSRRNPETLEVKYMLVGPSLASGEGQDLFSALFTIFFDHLQMSWQRGEETELVKLSDLTGAEDSRAVALLAEQGITTLPLYLFSARVSVASGRILSRDQRVLHREVQINRKSISGGNQS